MLHVNINWTKKHPTKPGKYACYFQGTISVEEVGYDEEDFLAELDPSQRILVSLGTVGDPNRCAIPFSDFSSECFWSEEEFSFNIPGG